VVQFLIQHVPTVWLGIGTVVVVVGLGMLGALLVRRRFDHDTLESHKEAASAIFHVIGVIYAVLLAFVVVIAWEQFKSAETTAGDEAVMAGNVYREAIALGQQGRALRVALQSYARSVAYIEWNHMAKYQKDSPQTIAALNTVWHTLKYVRPRGATQVQLLSNAINDVGRMSEDRRTRVIDSTAEIPAPLWIALIVGGAITIGFVYLVAIERFAAQAAMVAALGTIIAVSLFVILTLDLPFTGGIAVKPTAMRSVIAGFPHQTF
jgi:heme/copper-type cytochrome/quinol oxidase subunit 2